jgi:hypothetical protein
MSNDGLEDANGKVTPIFQKKRYFVLAPILVGLLSLGCDGPSSTPTIQRSLRARPPAITGKWHRKYHDKLGYPGIANIEFFESGDFSVSTVVDRSYKINIAGVDMGTQKDMRRESDSGTYKFIDNNHIKMGSVKGSVIYELISFSDKMLVLKEPDSTDQWTAGFETPPDAPGLLGKLPVEP